MSLLLSLTLSDILFVASLLLFLSPPPPSALFEPHFTLLLYTCSKDANVSLMMCVCVSLSPLSSFFFFFFVFSHHLYTCSLSPVFSSLTPHTHIHCHHHVALIDRRCHVNVRQTNKSTPGYVISFTFFSPPLLHYSIFHSFSRLHFSFNSRPSFCTQKERERLIHTQTLFLSLSIISL